MSKENTITEVENVERAAVSPARMSRRDLLRNTVVGMPAILTLHSGAALARSSNIVGIAPAGTRDLDGNALCVDTRTVEHVSNSSQVDFGEPAEGTVNILSERVYYSDKNKSGIPMNADMACHKGGPIFYHDEGWHEASLPANGVIVSATAIVSVSLRGKILLNRIA